jgi:predicted ABC-type ATPase
MSEIFVFGGCNGSGKSTFASSFLSKLNPRPEFINADLIAAQLNPNDVDSVAISAGRIMLERLNYLSELQLDFAFETTLAARSFARFLQKCQNNGYKINLIYVWLNSPQLAIERVAKRVENGGHHIPIDTIVRRYRRGLNNLLELYLPVADRFIVYDNSRQHNLLIAYSIDKTEPISIIQQDIWNQIIHQ